MCAIAGAYDIEDAAYVTYLMLMAMQHRGQEAAGIVSADGAALHEYKGFGLASEVFHSRDIFARLPGRAAIGHLRYATTGAASSAENIQPLAARLRHGRVAVVHNGNLTDFQERKRRLEEDGAIFRSTSDTELFLHELAAVPTGAGDWTDKIAASVVGTAGAYSLLFLTDKQLVALTDPLGFRPLALARYKCGYVFASETCAFDLIGATDVKHLEAGRLVALGHGRFRLAALRPETATRHCCFELVYFSRPDSDVFGRSAHEAHARLGAELGREEFVYGRLPPADLVASMPDSSNGAALAYSQQTGIPYEFAIIRSHWKRRTFIEPAQVAREFGVRLKLFVVKRAVQGKRVVVVDDSIVRGTTARHIVSQLLAAGAKEVHLRSASPRIIHPCHWGIDTPDTSHLIAAQKSDEEIRSECGAKSLAYLSLEGLRRALSDPAGRTFCTTCFSGVAPTADLVPAERLKRP